MERDDSFVILQAVSSGMICDFILKKEFVSGVTESPHYHAHSFYELYAVADGEMRIVAEEQEILLHASDVCVIPPDTYHYTYPDERSHRIGFCFRFYPAEKGKQEALYRQFSRAFGGKKSIAMYQQSDVYESFFSKAVQFLDTTSENAVATMLLAALLHLSSEQIPKQEPEQSYSDTKTAMLIESYINAHYREKIELTAIARLLNFSNRHTERVIYLLYGTTMTELVNRKRLAIAKFLLRKTEKTIEEIALLSGFCDKNYMHRRFKAAFSITPQAYRQKRN